MGSKYEKLHTFLKHEICALVFGKDMKEDSPQYRMADLWEQMFAGQVEEIVEQINDGGK